ncbi:hypothetical protein [Hoeflea sp.]|uniref:hypothetical protein n=1 Tax=Hoeflea sp. TaxID=1940281 RepID=UPI003B51E4DF
MASKSMGKQAGPRGGAWVPETCSKADLAVILNVSTRAVSDYHQKGYLVQAPQRGRYLTLPSIHGVIDKLRAAAAAKATSTGRSLQDERAETEALVREIKSIELAKLKGEVLLLSEVSEAWSSFAGRVKQTFLAIPGKMRATIPHLTAHDAETVKKICRDTLDELADEVEASVVGGEKKDISGGKRGR